MVLQLQFLRGRNDSDIWILLLYTMYVYEGREGENDRRRRRGEEENENLMIIFSPGQWPTSLGYLYSCKCVGFDRFLLLPPLFPSPFLVRLPLPSLFFLSSLPHPHISCRIHRPRQKIFCATGPDGNECNSCVLCR